MKQKPLIQLLFTFAVISVIGIVLYIINMNAALAVFKPAGATSYTSTGIHTFFTIPSIVIGVLCLLYCVIVLLPLHFAWNRPTVMSNTLLYYGAWAGTGLLAGALLLFSFEPIIALNAVPYGVRSDFNHFFEMLGYGWVNFMVYFTTITGATVFAFFFHRSERAVVSPESES